MASNLTFGQQLVSSGIVIPITADRTQGNDTTAKVDVSISDKVVNLIGTTMKTVTLNYSATSAKFEGLLTLEYGEIPATNYQSSFAIGGTIRGSSSFVSNTNAVHYMAPLNDVKVDSIIPGNTTVTLLCSHDGSVENSLNGLLATNNAYIRTFYLDANKQPQYSNAVVTLVVDTTKSNATRKHYKVVVSGLTNETEYELGLTMINQVGPTAASAAIKATPSQFPASLTFESFNSLDASGGRFNISLDNQADTVDTFKSLKLKVSYTSAQVTVPTAVQTIDLSNNYPNGVGAKRQFEFLMPADIKSALLTGSAFNKFTVIGYLEADISGATNKILSGVHASKDYYMDRPLTVSSFSLDAIDWSDGKQTLKASILGGTDICYNSVTATFDMCGTSISANPIIDLCNNVTSAKVAINYSELTQAKLSVKPRVKMSREELNNAAITNTSPFLELSHVLAALKQGGVPTVEFDPLPTETTQTATFVFKQGTNAISDLSANTFYRVQLDELAATTKSTVENKVTKRVSQITASGETFTIFSNTITAGIKCVLRAFTILDLSKYASRYAELNKGQQYLTSSEQNQSAVFKGLPEVSISLRPSTKTTEVLDTIRVSGNLKANNLDNIYVFGQDVCGNILYQQHNITATSTDICGRIMSDDATPNDSTDFAGLFTFDTIFTVGTTPFSHDPVYLHAILDTPDDVDKVQVRFETSEIETNFVAKVAAKYTASTAYTVALDLSNTPTNDVQYQVIDASFGAWADKITDLSNAIDASYGSFANLPVLRDGSNNGSKWLAEDTADIFVAKQMEKTLVHDFNATQLINYPAINLDTSYNTVIITNWRDVSNNAIGYVTSVKAFRDPVNSTVWGKSAEYHIYNDNSINGSVTDYSAARALAKARADAYAAVDAAQLAVNNAHENAVDADHAYKNLLSQIGSFSTSVKVMENQLADLKSEQMGFATSRNNRKAALVAAAAAAKLAKDTAESDLATARLAFFDASGNTLG